MDCDICSSRVASIHIQEIINGQRRALHLCAECAAERQVGQHALKDFTLADFLSSFAGLADELPAAEAPEYPKLTCPECGLKTTDFQESGSFGCPSCYQAFEEILEDLLPAMHREPQHVGKTEAVSTTPRSEAAPAATGARALKLQAEVLKRELADAIAVENYERAADLRDEISRLDLQPGEDV